jgi:malic enzyme
MATTRPNTFIQEGDSRRIQTTQRGYQVIHDPALNKGTDLAKLIYMWRLHDENETLFYALLQRHMLEMLPVVYDPVVGEAIEKYSEVMTKPRGVFLSIDDAEAILGIGDWGSNGIDISIGKLADYTAAAGVDPHRVIHVILDVGANNERLLYAVKRSGIAWKDQRVVIFGSSTAGCGIADQVRDQIVRASGLSVDEANRRIWIVQRRPLPRHGHGHHRVPRPEDHRRDDLRGRQGGGGDPHRHGAGCGWRKAQQSGRSR